MRKYDLAQKTYNDKQIKKFVQQRCDDYHSDQSRMIDSLLNRNKNKIVIDRLLYNDDNNQQFLTTDPDQIKMLTN